MVWSHMLPLGAALYLLESSLDKILTTGTATLIAFGIGAVGSILGTVVAWVLVGTPRTPRALRALQILSSEHYHGYRRKHALSSAPPIPPLRGLTPHRWMKVDDPCTSRGHRFIHTVSLCLGCAVLG